MPQSPNLSRPPRYDVEVIYADMDARGWIAVDLSAASGVPSATLARFLTNKVQSPRTAKKIALALKRPLSRYVVARRRRPRRIP